MCKKNKEKKRGISFYHSFCSGSFVFCITRKNICFSFSILFIILHNFFISPYNNVFPKQNSSSLLTLSSYGSVSTSAISHHLSFILSSIFLLYCFELQCSKLVIVLQETNHFPIKQKITLKKLCHHIVCPSWYFVCFFDYWYVLSWSSLASYTHTCTHICVYTHTHACVYMCAHGCPKHWSIFTNDCPKHWRTVIRE